MTLRSTNDAVWTLHQVSRHDWATYVNFYVPMQCSKLGAASGAVSACSATLPCLPPPICSTCSPVCSLSLHCWADLFMRLPAGSCQQAPQAVAAGAGSTTALCTSWHDQLPGMKTGLLPEPLLPQPGAEVSINRLLHLQRSSQWDASLPVARSGASLAAVPPQMLLLQPRPAAKPAAGCRTEQLPFRTAQQLQRHLQPWRRPQHRPWTRHQCKTLRQSQM